MLGKFLKFGSFVCVCGTRVGGSLKRSQKAAVARGNTALHTGTHSLIPPFSHHCECFVEAPDGREGRGRSSGGSRGRSLDNEAAALPAHREHEPLETQHNQLVSHNHVYTTVLCVAVYIYIYICVCVRVCLRAPLEIRARYFQGGEDR